MAEYYLGMVLCQLFRLPQELRDQIYRYALYNEDGLYYQTYRNGLSRLCKGPSTPSRSTIVRWLYRCTLRKKRKGYTRENNQLKYVCKRLYNETKELDMLHNLVIFQDAANKDALEQYTFLLQRCPALRQVAIKCSLPTFRINYMKQEFATIVRHCQLHVNVLVKIYVPYWSQEDDNFILTGLHFLSTLRADDFLMAQFAQTFQGPYRRGSHAAHAHIPNNMRVFPKEEKFCRHTLEQNYRANLAIRLPSGEPDLIEVMKCVEGWFVNGL
jgi:hypothetical protein